MDHDPLLDVVSYWQQEALYWQRQYESEANEVIKLQGQLATLTAQLVDDNK